MPENKLTASGLAGYGVSTFIIVNSMKKICEAFGDMGLYGVISPGHSLTSYASIVGSTWFIPALCALSFIPLVIKCIGYIPRKVRSRDYTGRQDKFPQDDVFQFESDTTC